MREIAGGNWPFQYGQATLAAGVVDIAVDHVEATSRVFATYLSQDAGPPATSGLAEVQASRVVGEPGTVRITGGGDAGDTSTLQWIVIQDMF